LRKLLLTCMAFILLSAAWAAPAHAGFKDVDDNPKYTWAKTSIDEMNLRGIVTGFPDGTFRPSQPVTKAQFTVMVYRLFPLLRNPEPEAIPGVPDNHWASKEFAELYSTTWPIYAADEQNFDNESYTYKPEKQMTRWEVLMTLDALFSDMDGPDFYDLTTSDAVKELARIKDVPHVQFASYEEYEKNNKAQTLMKPGLTLIRDGSMLDWAGDFDYVKANALYRFTKLGIITPDANGYFFPDRTITRAEIVTVLNRMLVAAGEDYAYVEPEESLSGYYLYPGSSLGFGNNIFYQDIDDDIVLAVSPDWDLFPGQRLNKVALHIESEQIVDVYVTINGQTAKYSYEQLTSGAGDIILDVTDVKSFNVRGTARYPERLTEYGNNDVMIYVKDPDMEYY